MLNVGKWEKEKKYNENNGARWQIDFKDKGESESSNLTFLP